MKLIQMLLLIMSGLMLMATGACSESPGTAELTSDTQLIVYKSPTCGCCNNWIEHITAHGFATDVVHPDDLAETKFKLGIASQYQSCHTAVTADGFLFEAMSLRAL